MTTKLPPNLLNTGAVIDRAYAEYTANANLSATIPRDNSIPQVTEGTQILSVTITPKSVANRLRVRFNGQFAGSGNYSMMAVFVNGATNAVAAKYHYNGGGASGGDEGFLEFEFVPGSTSAQTITVRVGPDSGTIRMNGTSSGAMLGGVIMSALVVEEIQA